MFVIMLLLSQRKNTLWVSVFMFVKYNLPPSFKMTTLSPLQVLYVSKTAETRRFVLIFEKWYENNRFFYFKMFTLDHSIENKFEDILETSCRNKARKMLDYFFSYMRVRKSEKYLLVLQTKKIPWIMKFQLNSLGIERRKWSIDRRTK